MAPMRRMSTRTDEQDFRARPPVVVSGLREADANRTVAIQYREASDEAPDPRLAGLDQDMVAVVLERRRDGWEAGATPVPPVLPPSSRRCPVSTSSTRRT